MSFQPMISICKSNPNCFLNSTRNLARQRSSILTISSSSLTQIRFHSNLPSIKSKSTSSNPQSTKINSTKSVSSTSRSELRPFHSSSSRLNANPTSSTSSASPSLPLYQGPLSSVFRRLKLFSLSSFGLATALTPVILFAPADLNTAGRIALVITALATSGSSTALIGWISGTYVSEMRLRKSYSGENSNAPIQELGDGKPKENKLKKSVLEDEVSKKAEKDAKDQVILETLQLNWLLVPMITSIYKADFLRGTERPFTSWELTKTPPLKDLSSEDLSSDQKDIVEILIAETRHAKSGALKGRYLARYSKGAKSKGKDGEWKSEGVCLEEGKVQRYFNVHEELLGEEWKVLG